MVEGGRKPLIQWIIEWLLMNGVRRIVLGIVNLKEKITNYLGDGSRFVVDIVYSTHTVNGGTGEGFRLPISVHLAITNSFSESRFNKIF